MAARPSRANSLHPRRPLVGLLVLAGGLAVAALLSRVAVARFWNFSAASLPERFPWGDVTEQGARTFEEAMGFVIIALLICPAANHGVVRALRRRAE